MFKQISATCITTKKYKIYDSFLTYTAIAKTFSHFDLYLIFQHFFLSSLLYPNNTTTKAKYGFLTYTVQFFVLGNGRNN